MVNKIQNQNNNSKTEMPYRDVIAKYQFDKKYEGLNKKQKEFVDKELVEIENKNWRNKKWKT